MKLLSFALIAVALCLNVGCTMCSHPFDYSYAAFDEAQTQGHRAGSSLAGYSSESILTSGGYHEETIIEEEVVYHD